MILSYSPQLTHLEAQYYGPNQVKFGWLGPQVGIVLKVKIFLDKWWNDGLVQARGSSKHPKYGAYIFKRYLTEFLKRVTL